MWKLAISLSLSTLLAGCGTTTHINQPKMVWMRLDGQKSTGNAKLEQEFYKAQSDCQAQRTAAINAAPPPASSMTEGQASQWNQRIASVYASCMNARGYRFGVRPAG